MTNDAPKDAIVVEITGHQFGWECVTREKMVYWEKRIIKNINNPSGNTLGVDFEDPESWDDIHVQQKCILPVGKAC